MDKQENLKILQEIHTGAKMGMNSISFTLDKVENEDLKNDLTFQYNNYNDILNKVNEQFMKHNEVPDESNMKDTVMAWTGIQLNTIKNKSNSHISDMLIQGTTMGVIEGRRILNNNPNMDTEIKQILNNFITMQENNIQRLKMYL